MEIRAKCKFNFESVRALTHISMYKKSNPKKRMLFLNIWIIVVLFIIILEIIIFGMDLPLVLFVIGSAVLLLWNAYMWFIFPKVRYNALAKLKDVENEYIFYDNILKISSQNQGYNAEEEIEYSLLVKVYETTQHLFLYRTNDQVFIIDKSTIEGGTVEEIRNKLSAFVKNKYIICKY